MPKKLLLRVTQTLRHNQETGEILVKGSPVTAAGTPAPGAPKLTLSGFSARGWLNGDILDAVGDYKMHATWGRVFAAQEVRVRAVTTPEQAAEFVASNVKGMGVKTAAELLEKLGGLEGFYTTFAKSPEAFFDHLTAKQARAVLAVNWLNVEHDADLLAIFRGAGVKLGSMRKIVKHFGAGAARDIIFSNPYQLCELRGIGFSTAEAIAKHLAKERQQPFDPTVKSRLIFGLVSFADSARRQGHTCRPAAEFMPKAIKALDLKDTPATRAVVEEAKKEAIARKLLVEEYGSIYSIGLWRAEKGVADNIVRILTHPVAVPASAKALVEKVLAKSELDEFQRAAVQTLIANRIAFLTGGPGVGKTTTLKRAGEGFKALKKDIVAAAPTGKAAKRLAQVTGLPASTTHKLLKLHGGDEDGSDVDARDSLAAAKRDFIRGDVAIFDESSMYDIFLFRHLVHRVKSGSLQLAFVGDVNQLPSIGPGEVFRDILESGVIPGAKLHKVYRVQGADPNKGLIAGAYAINDGQLPVYDTTGTEFRHYDAKPHVAKKRAANPGMTAAEALAEELRILVKWIKTANVDYAKVMGYDPIKDVQVLTATLAGPIGVAALNLELQHHLNPDLTGRAPSIMVSSGIDDAHGKDIKYWLRPGDKVLNTVNDDDLAVKNGDVGLIEAVHPGEQKVVVRYDDRETPVVYRGREQVNYLVLGFCYTIHKSQGSEYPIVLMPVHSSQGNMLYRQLFYTGVTRGKQAVAVFGDLEGQQKAVSTSVVGTRYGHLKQRLIDTLGAQQRRPKADGQRRLLPLGLLDDTPD